MIADYSSVHPEESERENSLRTQGGSLVGRNCGESVGWLSSFLSIKSHRHLVLLSFACVSYSANELAGKGNVGFSPLRCKIHVPVERIITFYVANNNIILILI